MAVWKHKPDDSKVSGGKRAGGEPTQPESGELTRKRCSGRLPAVYEESHSENDGDPEIQDLLPKGIFQMFLDQVNDSVLPSRWGSMWRYAAGLYLRTLRRCT